MNMFNLHPPERPPSRDVYTQDPAWQHMTPEQRANYERALAEDYSRQQRAWRNLERRAERFSLPRESVEAYPHHAPYKKPTMTGGGYASEAMQGHGRYNTQRQRLMSVMTPEEQAEEARYFYPIPEY